MKYEQEFLKVTQGFTFYYYANISFTLLFSRIKSSKPSLLFLSVQCKSSTKCIKQKGALSFLMIATLSLMNGLVFLSLFLVRYCE